MSTERTLLLTRSSVNPSEDKKTKRRNTALILVVIGSIIVIAVEVIGSLVFKEGDAFKKYGRYANLLVAAVITAVMFYYGYKTHKLGSASSIIMPMFQLISNMRWIVLVIFMLIFTNELIHFINERTHFIPETNKVGKVYIQNNRYITLALTGVILLLFIVQIILVKRRVKEIKGKRESVKQNLLRN